MDSSVLSMHQYHVALTLCLPKCESTLAIGQLPIYTCRRKVQLRYWLHICRAHWWSSPDWTLHALLMQGVPTQLQTVVVRHPWTHTLFTQCLVQDVAKLCSNKRALPCSELFFLFIVNIWGNLRMPSDQHNLGSSPPCQCQYRFRTPSIWLLPRLRIRALSWPDVCYALNIMGKNYLWDAFQFIVHSCEVST